MRCTRHFQSLLIVQESPYPWSQQCGLPHRPLPPLHNLRKHNPPLPPSPPSRPLQRPLRPNNPLPPPKLPPPLPRRLRLRNERRPHASCRPFHPRHPRLPPSQRIYPRNRTTQDSSSARGGTTSS